LNWLHGELLTRAIDAIQQARDYSTNVAAQACASRYQYELKLCKDLEALASAPRLRRRYIDPLQETPEPLAEPPPVEMNVPTCTTNAPTPAEPTPIEPAETDNKPDNSNVVLFPLVSKASGTGGRSEPYWCGGETPQWPGNQR
jgi:hypothetical protein